MFRKPKRSAKAALRKRKKTNVLSQESYRNSDDDENDAMNLLQSKKQKLLGKRRKLSEKLDEEDNKGMSSSLIHQYKSSSSKVPSAKELATREAEYHPESNSKQEGQKEVTNVEKPYKNVRSESKSRNKFLAGPLKAPTFVRTTCRFDYQPDICKDYKETGFCGFGDTCIYLHDRGDTLAGWQLEKEWEERKKRELEAKEKEMDNFIRSTSDKIGYISGKDETKNEDRLKGEVGGDDDGLPYACHICRGPFDNPVVTPCLHYFCEKCIMKAYKINSLCPICSKDVHGVFNFPTKLVSKKKKVLGSRGTWVEFFELLQKN